MILLDTNVVSEVTRPAPDPDVRAWLDAQARDALYLSAITVAELRAGVARLPVGQRRRYLDAILENEVLPLFAGRVRPFDMECTVAYAALTAKARTAGVAVATADGYIAAIALTNGFQLATRDTRPFVAAGVEVINPWGQTC
ncbi:MAG: type II toxin-antitoxin system VapC family toxin [Acidobacteria bacterium]|nr:MAG: type II toxin-antitoxin system VapC family toxin [Acidobacteriota bacterium]